MPTKCILMGRICMESNWTGYSSRASDCSPCPAAEQHGDGGFFMPYTNLHTGRIELFCVTVSRRSSAEQVAVFIPNRIHPRVGQISVLRDYLEFQ